MTARLPTQLTTTTGAPLPLPAMPQDQLLTVNIEQIPLFKDILGVPGIHIKPLRLDAEQVLYLEAGHLDAHAGAQDFHLAPGDFLFLPRGAGAALRCPTGRRASGFLIKGRLPSSASI